MTTTDPSLEHAAYPVRFDVEYPDRPLDRTSTALRAVLVVPVLALLATVSGGTWEWSQGDGENVIAGAGGLLTIGPALMITLRRKYPRWWFDFNLELQRFTNRVWAYVALMDDRYPSTTEAQAVRLEYDYPDVARDLRPWLPFVKWLLVVPHVLALLVLAPLAVLAVVAAWVAILVTGRYPRPLFEYVTGVLRWSNRVVGYAVTLVTDRYPPFRLS